MDSKIVKYTKGDFIEVPKEDINKAEIQLNKMKVS